MSRWVMSVELHHPAALERSPASPLRRVSEDGDQQWAVLVRHAAESGDERGTLTAVALKR